MKPLPQTTNIHSINHLPHPGLSFISNPVSHIRLHSVSQTHHLMRTSTKPTLFPCTTLTARPSPPSKIPAEPTTLANALPTRPPSGKSHRADSRAANLGKQGRWSKAR
ncbi:hypothetical protein K458DRAFT_419186 [Lentithecium fluviatile CBS 122367]|uniref:Uncharacterized protein n=1 Tax=Lentithecium fluviatile CBS 122367 TaxID=1168545 RepID=A0A6G1IYA2_9PLEO|nr:hypothetical protein K458DRAFT_419186 [Lentithecium fluviatile CBS 122367]